MITLGESFTHVTKEHNLVPVKEQWCCVAGKVTAGLTERNGSLDPAEFVTIV